MNQPYHFIVIYTISYLLFFILLWLGKKAGGLRLFDNKGFAANPWMLMFLHGGGIIIFGISPFLMEHQGSTAIFLPFNPIEVSTVMNLVFVFLMVFISVRISVKKWGEAPIAIFEKSKPHGTFLVTYFALRILFIFTYEMWFRGYFLNDCIAEWGLFWAILLNVIVYTVLHIVNGKEEIIVCIPFGLLLCCICIWQQAVWPAILIHLAFSIPYELSFLRRLKVKSALKNDRPGNSHTEVYNH